MSLAVKILKEDFLDKSPPLYSGGVFANVLGLHVFRTLYLNLWRLKPKKLGGEFAKYIDTLDKDGILVIPDFLPKEQFDAIKKEYDEAYSGWSPFDYNPEELSKRQKDFPEYFSSIAEKILSPKTPAFMEYFVNNEFITKLSEAVTHRTNNIPPHQHFWFLQRRSMENEKVGSLHTAGFPHADVPYPTVKVFLYMNDVNEDNAAYIFARGSHKLTLKRLLFEYKLSVSYAKTRNDIAHEEDVKDLGYKCESICGKANTLFISNNMGYHNRGDFSNLEPRQTVQLDFRQLETWRNILTKKGTGIFSKVSRRFVKNFDKGIKEKRRAGISNNNMS
jgi:hypothetical protein